MSLIYDHGNIQIYHGNCVDIMPQLQRRFNAVITDPIWPNAPVGMFDVIDSPYEILKKASLIFPSLTDRVVIQMGCNSDPRFLNCLPDSMPFFRHAFLEYLIPYKSGRVLYTHDVAYIFGKAPSFKKGQKVIPGRCLEKDNRAQTKLHPCPRRITHVKWLVKWFSDNGPVLDPFCGYGTTLLACRILGIPCVGIEIDKRHANNAVKRLQEHERALQIPFDITV